MGVRIPPAQLAAVDRFIAERAEHFGEQLSRPEAVRRLMAEALVGMGLHPPE